jgi:putative ABC transport system substrate-binding protein
MRVTRTIQLAAAALLLVLSCPAEAQQATPRIGYLKLEPRGLREEAFRQGLRDLGYIEGQNITIEWRFADGKIVRLSHMASELVRFGVDVIVTGGHEAIVAARGATQTIPIVMTFSGGPIGSGFVSSLAKPGGNMTGLTSINHELAGKRLELLREVVPRVLEVSVLWQHENPLPAPALKELENAAQVLRLKLQMLEVREVNELDRAFSAMTKANSGAVLVLPGGLFANNRNRLVNLAAINRLPAMYTNRPFVEAGGLMAYGTNLEDLHRRAAIYVDKILKGSKPADLPVEQPTKFELVVNLKTAKQIGLPVPPNVLARADRVIR